MSEARDRLKTMLYLYGVSVSFDGFKALNNLSIIVHPSEMLAIIGPNGAGKTTMMDIITGKTRPDAGEVFFDGTDRPHPARRSGDRQSRHRPQVPEADGVREPDRLGQSRDGAEEAARRVLDARLRRRQRRHRAASRRSSRPSASPPARATSPPASATARSNGSRSACCWRRTPSCCWSTSRSPA